MPRFNEPLTMTPEQFDRLDGRLSQVVDLLGLLIAVHEYGHYRVAVACGVKVLRFSVGFGKPLWSRDLMKEHSVARRIVRALLR